MVEVTIDIPMALRQQTAGRDEVRVHGETVVAALEDLAARFPGVRRHLFDEAGHVRPFVNLYVNEKDVRRQAGGQTGVAAGDRITIVPSIAGGAAQPEPAGPGMSPEELQRYARHIVLPDVGLEGQRRLKAARVLVVGAGGLGSPAALYLAAAGVGTLGLVDFDDVEASNLQRQVLYGEWDIGRPKLDAAEERLQAVNPHVRVEKHPVKLTSANALEILGRYDIVVDGSDNFPTRYLVNDACVLLGKPCVYGSIYRFEGQVSVFDARSGPCYRCLFREPPPPGLVPSCAEGGVLGVLPGVIGSLQALETIKLITGAGQPLVGRLLLFDALKLRWRELNLRRNPECPVCGDTPTITELIDYDAFCGVAGAAHADTPTAVEPVGGAEAAEEITPAELMRRLDRGDDIMLLDVREPFEWLIANLGDYGARMIPMHEIPRRIDELDPSAEIVVYCQSGVRSADVQRFLRGAGFQRVRNLNGGILRWQQDVDPTIRRY
ncbi:MAG: molybdopterin-synthase adenylyltransferase MoeB [Gemmatimonadota bacterium]|jgi:molybdopterin/thiamine biosynthesis adenylyltransferase/rhodanese-related sulfurtransferase/molybdopterin converting factor small subunit